MARRNLSSSDPLARWSIADSRDLYSIERWSEGYFDISREGNVVVTPHGDGGGSVDLKALVDEIQERGIKLPLLLRFSDVLRSRIERLNQAFATSMSEYDYKGKYRGVYPIKVNQARTVVQEIVEYGAPYHYGLEAGSKPELLACIAHLSDPEALIICNGYKDDAYIEMALLASELGRIIVLVVEKPSEYEQIMRVADRLGIEPRLGIRSRLSARGSGKWESSAGDRSKFGLSTAQILDVVARLKERDSIDRLVLLHFHLGSQISAIRSIKNALMEAARIYAGLRDLGCTALDYLDVGGGLGVDYDGSQTNFASSMNYTVQEYANDVVYEVMQVCDATGVPHPTLVTEAGRAVTAHHSVLIVDVLAVTGGESRTVPQAPPEDAGPIAANLFDIYRNLTLKTLRESFHDATTYKEQALQLFNLGHLSLAHRVLCEEIFWATMHEVLTLVRQASELPDDLRSLEAVLSDTYFLNFSMFQSLPDAWAVDQLFPIMPIHRLTEEPTARGILADITCDSDGAIKSFIDPRDVKNALELHPLVDGERYLLGFFLVGAYQEILGDMHNLFGDTATVHVSLGPDGRYCIEDVFPGDTVTEVLAYVNYSRSGLVKRMRRLVEDALRDSRISLETSRRLMARYRENLEAYTYLEL